MYDNNFVDFEALGYTLGKSANPVLAAARGASWLQRLYRGARAARAAHTAARAARGVQATAKAVQGAQAAAQAAKNTTALVHVARGSQALARGTQAARGAQAASRAAQAAAGAQAAARGARAARAAHAATQAARAARAAGIGQAARSAIGWTVFPRPIAGTSLLLRLPSQVLSGLRHLSRLPRMQPVMQVLRNSKVTHPMVRGLSRAANASAAFGHTRAGRAVSALGRFVEGGGGRASKAFMVADAALPAIMLNRYVNPATETQRAYLGGYSPFVANVSPHPGVFTPMARPQSVLVNPLPGQIMEYRTRKFLDNYNRGVQQYGTLTATDIDNVFNSRYETSYDPS